MKLTLISRVIDKTVWYYVVDIKTAVEKMNEDDVWVYMPVPDQGVIDYFCKLYTEIKETNTAPGRMGDWFRMLAVEGEWYLAEIELSNNKKHYPKSDKPKS